MLPSIFFLFSCASTYSVFLVSTEPDDAIREPMLAVIHAAHRTELQELHVLKDMLSARYGSEFADAALENPMVVCRNVLRGNWLSLCHHPSLLMLTSPKVCVIARERGG